VTLRELLSEVDVIAVHGGLEVPVSGLALDSRAVRPGDVFFALGGAHREGTAYAGAALRAGASAVVVPRGAAIPEAPRVEVADPRLALAQAAARFHGHPSRALTVVAVTGTNGKTTTTWMLESIFRAAGRASGVIGTTGYRIGAESRPAPFTTPEAPQLQALLREMVERGLQAVAIEISSHALVQRRPYGLECDVVVFTNLTQDHLDYHGTMEAYLDAKLMLFDGRNGPSAKRGAAVVNRDDPSGPRVIAAATRGGFEVWTIGETPGGPARAGGRRVTIERVEPLASGLRVALEVDGARSAFSIPLFGRFNASNAAAACAAGRSLGIPMEQIARGLETMPVVPGRLERVEAGQPFAVLVDYAHTPDALVRALAAAREHAPGRVLLVFGCGGDRDRAKRPIMGRVAAEGADRAWVTNDNPRSEDPRAIAASILAGAPAGRLGLELDRRAAIAAALAEAGRGDAVLIAGKGHETTQTIGDRVLPFDDRAVARELLLARRGGGA
jgi:UDP-N-acetylmuramoyl-L-alanyl-D-glutamate--2,6-diaminopimelate ligase